LHPLLHINNLEIDFEGDSGPPITAVNQISFHVNKGEIVGIAGESGSGKSVTSLAVLQLLGRNARYRNGEITFSEGGITTVDLLNASAGQLQQIRGKKIAMIFQEPMTSLNPVYTCGEQVAEAIRAHSKAQHETARAKTLALFEKVKLPDPPSIYNRYPHELSGGQKQRVMIAMAMSSDPLLLICDEPTTALDVTVQRSVLELIRELQRETGMGVIFITHDLGVISQIADRVLVMYKGKIVEDGSVQQVFSAPRHQYTKALLACRPSIYDKGTRLPVVSDFLQRTVSSGSSTAPANKTFDTVTRTYNNAALIHVNQLTVEYVTKRNFFGKPTGTFKAVDAVTFDVFRGETLGLVGESGCGKTTLGRALLRLVKPSSGTVKFEGEDMEKMSAGELRQFRRNIQLIFQDPYSSLNPSLTVGSLIAEPILVHFPGQSARQRKEQVMSLLQKVGLDGSAYSRYPHEFSGGQRQRIVIARALALQPKFIVFDESVSALDVSVQAQVLNLLNDLRAEYHFTSIFITHDLSVVKYVSDRIMVMQHGRIVESGQSSKVLLNPESSYTKTLLASMPQGFMPNRQ
jgi:peptide/nickel transport system ATP-binding protein